MSLPMAGSGTTGDVISSVAYFSSLSCKMYDIEPVGERISRANILVTGIPEPSASFDYVFLDPPADFYPRGDDSSFSPDAAKAETMMRFKTIARESVRTLKPGGRISVIVEASTGSFGVIDFPFEVIHVFRELGLSQIGKVYLPRRGETPKLRAQADALKPMASECRELLTFEKPSV